MVYFHVQKVWSYTFHYIGDCFFPIYWRWPCLSCYQGSPWHFCCIRCRRESERETKVAARSHVAFRTLSSKMKVWSTNCLVLTCCDVNWQGDTSDTDWGKKSWLISMKSGRIYTVYDELLIRFVYRGTCNFVKRSLKRLSFMRHSMYRRDMHCSFG